MAIMRSEDGLVHPDGTEEPQLDIKPSTAQQNLLNVVSTQEYQIASLREEVESLKQQLQEAQSRIEQMEAVQPQANGAPGDKITQGE